MAFRPILSRLRPRSKPSASSVSTTISEVPLAPCAGSVLATTMIRLASWPLVMKVLEPLMRYWLPSFSAARLDALQVGAGAGLGHGDGADQFAGGQPRQPVLLLLLRAVVEDVGRDDRVVQARCRSRRRRHGRCASMMALSCAIGAAGAAVFLRHRGAEQAGLAGLQPALAVDDLVLLELVVARRDLLRQEADAPCRRACRPRPPPRRAWEGRGCRPGWSASFLHVVSAEPASGSPRL